MKTINLKLETKEIKGYDITQMKEMFGNRIKRAIAYSEPNKNGRSYAGLRHKKMLKLCKRWKFWNKDIRQAYKKYFSLMFMPYTISHEEPEICYDGNIDWSKYSEKINAKYYENYIPK